MIYTSYYGRADKVPNPIAISRGVPHWFKGEVYEKLAPSWELVKAWNKGHGISEREYTERYLNELTSRSVTAETIQNEIPEGSTLLCWETPLAFCHRHIISWILRNAGIDSKEWEVEENAATTKRKKSSTSKSKTVATGKRRGKKQIKQSEPGAMDSTGDLLLQ